MAITPCPVCGLEGGFHDTDNKVSRHAQHEVPRELLKETGWHKLAHEELVRERAEKIAVLAAEIDDDKQAWHYILGAHVCVKGTRPTGKPDIVITNEEGAEDLSLLPLSSGGVG